MSVLHLTTAAFDEATAEGISMVDFWAEWCGPCKMLAPTIESLGEQYGEQILVGKVNVDDEPELAQRFGVMSIPTVVFLRDGEEFDRKVGLMPIENYQELLRDSVSE